MKTIYTIFFLLSFIVSFGQETSKEFQENLNKEYANKEESPLMKEDLEHFQSLDFFPINDKFIVQATFKRTKKEKVFEMKTSTERLPLYKKYGELEFTIDGVLCKLNVYQNMSLFKKPGFKDYLFLPFSDLTSGNESYIGGRYVDLRIQKGNQWIIDFNKAYNPYCAYNYKYSCPIVPMENDLKVSILAGVKKFHD